MMTVKQPAPTRSFKAPTAKTSLPGGYPWLRSTFWRQLPRPLRAQIILTAGLMVGALGYVNIEVQTVFRYKLLLILFLGYAVWMLWRPSTTGKPESSLSALTLGYFLSAFYLINGAVNQSLPVWLALGLLCLLAVIGFLLPLWLANTPWSARLQPLALLLLIGTLELTTMLLAWPTHPANRAAVLTLWQLCTIMLAAPEGELPPLNAFGIVVLGLLFSAIVVTMSWSLQ